MTDNRQSRPDIVRDVHALSLRGVVILGFVVAITTILTAGGFLWFERQRILDDAAQQAVQKAELIANHAEIIYSSIDGMFDTVERFVQEGTTLPLIDDVGAASPEFRQRVNGFYARLVADHAAISGLWVLDAAGRGIASSEGSAVIGMDLSDRDYFRKAIDRPTGHIAVAHPVIARAASVEGIRISVVSRVIRGPEGEVMAVMAARLSDEFLNRLKNTVASLDAATIGVYLTDGSFVGGLPDPRSDALHVEPVIADIANGLTAPQPVTLRLGDGVERIGALAPVPGLPLVTFSGVSKDAILVAKYQPRTLATLLIAALLLVGLLVTTRFAVVSSSEKAAEKLARLTSEAAASQKDAHTRRILDSLADAVLTIDAQGRVINANKSAAAIFDVARHRLLDADSGGLIVLPDGRPLLARLNDVDLSRERSLKIMNAKGLRTTGGEFPADLSISASEDGGARRFSIIVRDRTEHDRAEKLLRRVGKMDAIGRLAGGVAHDFNNLLGIILGNLEIIGLDASDRQKPRLAACNRAASRAADLTRKLLTFSRAQALTAETVPLNTRIREIEPLLQQALQGHWTLELHLAETATQVSVDPGELEDAILNLVLNARDASPDGGPVMVETGHLRVGPQLAGTLDVEPGSYMVLSVSDHGVGMSSEERDRVFEPFYTTKESGTGLGLASVYGFVRRSSGAIRIYSEVGVGSTFKIILPEASVADPASGRLRGDGDAALPRGRGQTILVVDDETDLREVAELWLKDLGYSTITAASGADALDILRDDALRIDLLFTDIVLPGGMNGDQLALTAVGMDPDLRVVMASGFTWTAWSRSRPAGTQPFPMLQKPYNRRELAAVVASEMTIRETAAG